ncbi:hypothetical protein BDV96DRAFT_586888 [Lophiotrema nucula]|uniref:Uncharacterized protein n=1 Tax=Lophiotrema nucula TaxID=690887 RepID=A0A6A5YPP4_9PLEO|nr:hypothetical protein BDV96DRAFT_586888 [Lophiotrema nucula]
MSSHANYQVFPSLKIPRITFIPITMLTKVLLQAALGAAITSAIALPHVEARDVEYEKVDCVSPDNPQVFGIRIEDYGELDHKGLNSAVAQGCADAKMKMDSQQNVTGVDVWIDNVQGPWVWLSNQIHGVVRLQINVQDTDWKSNEDKWIIDVDKCIKHTQGAFTTPDRCYRESEHDTFGGVFQVKDGPYYSIWAYDQKMKPPQA